MQAKNLFIDVRATPLCAERRIRIEVDVPEGTTARVQREDLDEMLGNLLAYRAAHAVS